MSITRRSFLASLAASLGAANVRDLTGRIEDLGKPLLLEPGDVEQTLHVYEGGLITLGPQDGYDQRYRPTWRELMRVEGVAVDDPAELAAEMAHRWMDPKELDHPISDVCWPMAEACTWNPAARAERLLTNLKVGSSLRGKGGRAGRLDFHYGDNHPGSSDIWVDARDDLSVSLLQARLIELGQPIRVVMEVSSIRPIS